MKAMSEVLQNELSLMKQKQEKKMGNDAVDIVQGAKSEKKGQNKQAEQHTMIEDEKESSAESLPLVVGGENGLTSVVAAKLAGLFPVVADEGHNYVVKAQSEMVLSKVEYCVLKEKRQREEKQNEHEEFAVQVGCPRNGDNTGGVVCGKHSAAKNATKSTE